MPTTVSGLAGLAGRAIDRPELLPDLALAIHPTTTVTHLRVGVAISCDQIWSPPLPTAVKVLAWRKLHFGDTHKWSNEVQVREVTLTPAAPSAQLDFEFSLPPAAGEYAFLCSVDPDYRVTESDEGNNWTRFPAGASFLRWP